MKVERAIIMAAGKGTRMRPLTYETPKPLIEVNGQPMIETIIKALSDNDIKEIYVVVGYLKDHFKYLEIKYSNLKLVNNPYYDECNNISSLYVAREHLENSIIVDGDQVISNPKVFANEFEDSGYAAIWTENAVNEWMLKVNGTHITGCVRNETLTGWRLYSISRWSAQDAAILRVCIEQEFKEHQNSQIYWDDVPIFLYADRFDLHMTKISAEDIQEIDSIVQLANADNQYQYLIAGDKAVEQKN